MILRLAIGALALAGACLGCEPPATADGNLYVDNRSGMTVIIATEGKPIAHVKPGFRGVLATIGSSPRAIVVTTEGGTRLGEWTPSTPTEVWGFFPDPACGDVMLWLGDPAASFDPIGPIDPSACPR